jgi:hypothetical protein
MRHQSCKRRDASFRLCGLQEPLAEPQRVQPHGREDVSQVRPSEADGARPSKAHATCLARDRPFDAGAARILHLKRGCRFPLPGCLEGLILRLRPDGERPSGIALLRAYTLRHVVAALTILARELHLNDRMLAVIDGGRPADTGLAGWTGRVLLVPIDLEMLGVKAGSLAGLPMIIEARGVN